MNTIKNMQIHKNIRAYYYGQVDWLGFVIVGIFHLWVINGMSLANILYLQGLFGLFTLLFEVPSGVLADIWDRKKVLIIGKIGMIIGMTVYLVANKFALFLLAEFFFAIGFAAKSGTDTAFVWDSATDLENKAHIVAKGKSVQTGSAVINIIIGSFIVAMNVSLALAIAIIGTTLSVVFYATANEPERARAVNSTRVWKDSIKFLSKGSFLMVVALTMIGTLVLRIAFWSYMIKLETYAVKEMYYGIVLGLANFIAFLTVTIYARRVSEQSTMTFKLAVIAVIGILLFVVDTNVGIIYLGIALHQIVRGVVNVLSAVQVNNIAQTEVRASVGSLNSSVSSVIFLIVTGLFDLLNVALELILQINLVFVLVLVVTYMSMQFKSSKAVILVTI